MSFKSASLCIIVHVKMILRIIPLCNVVLVQSQDNLLRSDIIIERAKEKLHFYILDSYSKQIQSQRFQSKSLLCVNCNIMRVLMQIKIF